MTILHGYCRECGSSVELTIEEHGISTWMNAQAAMFAHRTFYVSGKTCGCIKKETNPEPAPVPKPQAAPQPKKKKNWLAWLFRW